MSDETPPFNLDDFAIEGWEVRARTYQDRVWEVVWRRNARYVSHIVAELEVTESSVPRYAIGRIVEYIKAYIEYRDRNGWPENM